MRPVGGSATSVAKASLWHSPVPYLFGGIGAMLFLIAVALLVLACSHKKRSNSDLESSSRPKSETNVDSMSPVDREPPIFVIVPGETVPSFLAKPASRLK
ncbi:Protein GLUTAMINE DUMPER 1 [Rhynchospora pubera]|uniref:Protein GLUTAMINE DUMPER 1 n=1 Tax=Rhynchospora pubera TaxID=906938 RepID=A0AAV8C0M2_9POAL|nr:Protein GLUTAMINE DUMPER 1 [Rhynchospora pubera]KAJ4798885.1 Protein GLUTAMINE DUMPER 1 [Rhynchospora pubera]